MKKYLFVFFAGVSCNFTFSQVPSGMADTTRSFFSDSVKTIPEVVVSAFQSRLHWKTVPASVSILGTNEINRYASGSMVPVLNTVPGVRMEERTPASYRLSFRGSLLRSPFGVRNIKVYWNDIPLSDAGGNTYLNLLDLSQISGAEILKGPVASMYGAGTGGALLLYSDGSAPTEKNRITAALTGGSYGLFQQQAGWEYTGKGFTSVVRQSHQQYDGYREQSATRKDMISWNAGWQWAKQELSLLAFYTDLYYQTPGGITLAQMQADPKLSRQPAGSIPGSVQQKAAIYNKTILAALRYETGLSDHWKLRSFITGSNTSFRNPFITNYEKRKEKNMGAGTTLVFSSDKFQWLNGAEWLYNQSAIDNYGNRSGTADTVQYRDNIFANQWFVFSQMQYIPANKWNITAGISINHQSYRYKRLSDPASVYLTKSNRSVLTPRLAVSYRLTHDISWYALMAKGFSPPALAELRPSDGQFHGDLNAEYGWNYETGIKGELLNRRLQFDIAVYFFRLENAIVRRIDSSGAEFFINAGSTKQDGFEAMIRYQLLQQQGTFFKSIAFWSSYCYQPYRFENYQQGAAIYSGNALTGVPKHVWVSGVDIQSVKGWYLNASLNRTSSLPLNDAGDAYADAYTLVQVKTGYRLKKHWHFFTGMDNALNQVYSLGNDINAFGRRFYNPAPGRSVFAGIAYGF